MRILFINTFNMGATFLDFEYIRQYYKSNAQLPLTVYGPYFPYRTIDPLIGDVINAKHFSTFWSEIIKSNYGSSIFGLLHKPEYQLVMSSLIKHGYNITEFLHRKIGHDFKRNLLLNKDMFLKLKTLHRECLRKEINDKYLLDQVLNDYCGLLLFNCLTAKEKDEIRETIEFAKELSTCKICGNRYQQIYIPTWVYYRVNGNTGICYECPVTRSSRKSDLLNAIKALVENVGFIPNTGFHRLEDNSFSIRVCNDKWERSFNLMLKFKVSSGSDPIKSKFGDWFTALVEAGVLTNDQLKTSRGIKCLAESGNLCNSMAEQFIDNWMFSRGVKPLKEPKYPVHPVLNAKGLMRADWYVNDFYIEYFGLKGEIKYDEKTIRKLQLIKDLNLNIISLYPEDMSNLQQKLYSVIP